MHRRLQQAHPRARLLQHSQRLDDLEARLERALQSHLKSSAARLDSAVRALQTVSPLATLGRGFAVLTRCADGALISSAAQLAAGECFAARLAEGSLRAKVIERRS